MLQRLKDRLNLTDDQATKIQGLLKDQQAKMSALFNDDSLSREDRRTKMTDLRKAAHDQIRAVLTPDQQKIFDAMPMDGPRGRRRQGDDNSPPPAPPPPPPANNT
jgi:Spy/CpxP family protein refolding chaperone